MIRQLGRNYAWLYGRSVHYTLGLWPLFAGWKLFWLIPGVGLFESARHLARGTTAPRQPIRNLIAMWVFAVIVVAYTWYRRYGS